jgi:hypothetical protein
MGFTESIVEDAALLSGDLRVSAASGSMEVRA